MSAAGTMARTFTITCAAGTIRLAGQARGECSFTVTNSSGAAVRAQPVPVALDARAHGWFSVAGEALRELAPGQTVQVTVAIAPAGAPPGRYHFRLDVATPEGREHSSGPEACVELTSEAPPAPVGRKPFPWWWLALAAALLVAIALTLWLTLGRSRTTVAAEPPAITAPAPTTVADSPDGLAERWLAAFRRQDAKALTALTAPPALIVGTRADDRAAILARYAALLDERPPATRLGVARAPARPLLARVRDIGAKLPPAARAIGLDDDDHAVGVTVEDAGLKLVLLIRREPPLRIAGVLR